jgi:hypothetical protein
MINRFNYHNNLMHDVNLQQVTMCEFITGNEPLHCVIVQVHPMYKRAARLPVTCLVLIVRRVESARDDAPYNSVAIHMRALRRAAHTSSPRNTRSRVAHLHRASSVSLTVVGNSRHRRSQRQPKSYGRRSVEGVRLTRLRGMRMPRAAALACPFFLHSCSASDRL